VPISWLDEELYREFEVPILNLKAVAIRWVERDDDSEDEDRFTVFTAVTFMKRDDSWNPDHPMSLKWRKTVRSLSDPDSDVMKLRYDQTSPWPPTY
jgi:hypothetical protein